jgi:Protein of unknown function (DUF3040)
MSLSYRQQCQLRRIESRLLRSDPQLAAMLAMFDRLAAGQHMPGWEQAATRSPDRIRQAVVLVAKATVAIAAAFDLLVSAVLALLTALIVSGRARSPQPTRQQTGPGGGPAA